MKKPLQLNLLQNTAWRSPTNINQNDAQLQPTLPAPMPYGYYPSPHMYFPNPMQQQWPSFPHPPSFPQPPGSQAYDVPQPNPTVPLWPVRGPCISDWLQYCDCIPGRDREAFFSLAYKFDEQGYRTIDQLTRSRMSVKIFQVGFPLGRVLRTWLFNMLKKIWHWLETGSSEWIQPQEILSPELGILNDW